MGATQSEIGPLISHIEEIWGHLDELFDSLNAEGGWSEKHGPDWTFSDVPYHLSYCDHDMVARAIKLGRDLPTKDRWSAETLNELNAWNETKFAERPEGQTVAQSLEQVRASREALRRATSGMSDSDLDRPAWFPLVMLRGWRTVRASLEFCRQHSWSEFMQLRIRMGRDTPVPSAPITNIALGGYVKFLPFFVDREAAASSDFTMVMEFTEPGVDPWTIRVANGGATVVPGAADQNDLVITQSPTAFVKTFNNIQDPMELIQAGDIKPSNFEGMKTFGALFPPPDPDRVWEALPE